MKVSSHKMLVQLLLPGTRGGFTAEPAKIKRSSFISRWEAKKNHALTGMLSSSCQLFLMLGSGLCINLSPSVAWKHADQSVELLCLPRLQKLTLGVSSFTQTSWPTSRRLEDIDMKVEATGISAPGSPL